MTVRTAALLSLLVLLTGCSGVDELQRCIDHSVEEGVTQELAEQGCRDALVDE